ncbi:hypothetical protein F66182_1498 [Fusarium sp. NRRL 66182]|nr:hypothetical protein F66182_1498 [Fusarium sp. NRRL 66182]
MHAITMTAVLASALAAVNATPVGNEKRHLIGKLDSSASEIEHRFQPATDFDTDGCYYTSAIDKDGRTNGGLTQINVYAKGLAADCRHQNRLENNNLYSRRRCNNGWCAIMYEYYFEKDQLIWGSINAKGSHTHDWENIIVFVKDDEVKRVAPSCHGNYGGATNTPRLDGKHAKVVYHKDSGRTHCWRMANEADDGIENYTGKWFIGNLIGWDNWPAVNGRSLRDSLWDAWHGDIRPKFWNDDFTNTLRAAAGDGVPGFDPAVDE